MAFKMKGSPIKLGSIATKSALKQYTEEEKEGFVYSDEVVTENPDRTTTYTKSGTKPGERKSGVRSGNPERSRLMSEAIARGDETFEYDGRTYTTERGSSTAPETHEVSYTTKPDIVPITLDPISPELLQPTPELVPATPKKIKKKKAEKKQSQWGKILGQGGPLGKRRRKIASSQSGHKRFR